MLFYVGHASHVCIIMRQKILFYSNVQKNIIKTNIFVFSASSAYDTLHT